jgi:hypothetical protein
MCSVHERDEKCWQNFGWKAWWVETTQKTYVGPTYLWEDTIKIGRREMGFKGVDWIHLAQDMDLWQALVNMVMNLLVP